MSYLFTVFVKFILGVLGEVFSKGNSVKYEYIRLNTFAQKDNGSHYATLRPRQMLQQKLKCPICDFENSIPPRGVQDLPPHYLLQHRMLLHSVNKEEICLLCDLCSSETPVGKLNQKVNFFFSIKKLNNFLIIYLRLLRGAPDAC